MIQNWLYQQLILTLHELAIVVTIPHIIAGLASYAIIHRLLKVPDDVIHLTRKERQAIINKHIKHGHTAKLKHCVDHDCHQLGAIGRDLQVLQAVQVEQGS